MITKTLSGEVVRTWIDLRSLATAMRLEVKREWLRMAAIEACDEGQRPDVEGEN